MKKLLLAILITVAWLGMPQHSFAAYGFYRTITIDHTKVPTADQTNFPVKIAATTVSMKSTGNGGNVTSTSGFDIQFYSNSSLTTLLECERVRYEPTTGQYVFFVKVPTVATAADTVIYMAYGNSSVTTNQCTAANVWDSNFKAVYHFGDTSALSMTDSTSNANTLTNHNTTLATGPDGSAGVQFAGGTNSWIHSSTTPITGPTGTAELMFNPPNTTTSAVVLGFQGITNGLGIIQEVLTRNLSVMRVNQQAATVADSASSAYSASVWNYAAGTWNGTSDRKIHPNGIAPTQNTTAAGANTADLFALGARVSTTGLKSNAYAGIEAEVRVSSTVRASDWIVTTYNNLINLSTFYALGSETATGGGATPTFAFHQFFAF